MKKTLQKALILLLALLLALAAIGCDSQTPPTDEDPSQQQNPPQNPQNPDTGNENNTPTPPSDPQPSSVIAAENQLWLSMTEHLSIPAFTDASGINCRIVQGGCTDGTYYYAALNDGKNDSADSISAIRKYDLATGKLLATFEGLNICHCNDMTYNSKTNELLMVHNAPERWVISVFDGTSMVFKRKIEILPEIYSLSYDPYEDCYWAGLSYGYNFIKLNTDLEQVGEVIEGVNTGYTKQGMDVDDKYVYFLQYKSNSIIVYDKSGGFVREITLPRASYEAEHIFHIGDTFYIAYYNSPGGGTLYKTAVFAIPTYTISATMTQLEVLDTLNTDGTLYKVPQGSACDGTHLYQMLNNDLSSGYRSVIHKINPQTGEIIDTLSGFSTGLSNDMTYNKKNDQFVVVHNKPDSTKLSIFDAETMTLVNTVTVSTGIYCIAYDEVKDCYYAGLSGTYDFAQLDADFNVIATFGGHNSGNTKQGVDCDGEYIYFLQSATNSISIYQTNGAFIGHVDLPESGSNTAQSICHVGDVFYIAYNVSAAGGLLYRVSITME